MLDFVSIMPQDKFKRQYAFIPTESSLQMSGGEFAHDMLEMMRSPGQGSSTFLFEISFRHAFTQIKLLTAN